MARRPLVAEAPREVAVGVNPPVPQEGPVRAGGVDVHKVDGDNQDLLPRRGGPGEHLASRARDEASAPELDASAARGLLEAYPVADRDETAVRDGVGALD